MRGEKNLKKGKKLPIILSQSQVLFRHLFSPQLVLCHFCPPVLCSLSLFLLQVPSVPIEEVKGGTGDGAQFTVVPLCQSFLLSVCVFSGMPPPWAGGPRGCACSAIVCLLLLLPSLCCLFLGSLLLLSLHLPVPLDVPMFSPSFNTFSQSGLAQLCPVVGSGWKRPCPAFPHGAPQPSLGS